MALAMRVPWSHGYKNQFQVLSLMDYGTLEMSLCKLADNGESVLWMGAADGPSNSLGSKQRLHYSDKP